MPPGLKKILKRTLKIVAWIVASIVLILVAAVLLIRLPAVQNRITQKAVGYLEGTIGTKVTLGGVVVGFPKSIVLKDLYLEDRQADTLLYVGRLSIDTDLWGLTRNEIQLNNIDLSNTVAIVRRAEGDSTYNFSYIPAAFASEPDMPDTVDQAPWSITLKTLKLENIRLRFDDRLTGNLAEVALGILEINIQTFDLENNIFAVEDITLENSRASIRQTKSTKPGTKASAVDFNNLSLTGLNITVTDTHYDDGNIKVTLNELSFRERSGFAIQSLTGDINITETSASVEDLLLVTDNSRLEFHARATYPSFADIGQTWQQAEIAARLQNSQVNLRDIRYFNPTFTDSLPVRLPDNTELYIDGDVSGRLNNLEIRQLNLSSLTDTYIHTSGQVKGLPDTDSLQLDIAVDKLRTTRADLVTILPDTLLPDSIVLPLWMELDAKYVGSLRKATFAATLRLDEGALESHGDFNLDSTSVSRGVNLDLSVTDLPIGRILGQPDSVIGTLALTAKFKTQGLSPAEMNGTLQADVGHFDYQGYRYEGLVLEGVVRDQIATLHAGLDDENLDFTVDAQYDFNDEIPRYDFTFDLRNGDFGALNLTANPLRARGILTVDLATSDFKVLNGNVGIRKVAVYNGDDLYAVDSLLFASIDQEGRSEISIDSDLLTGRFEGSINIFGLPSVMREYFHSYYALHDSLEVNDATPQHFTFEIQLRNTDLLTKLIIPELTTFEPGPIRGAFDSETRNLDITLEARAIRYGNIGIRSLTFTTESDERSLWYNLAVDKILVDSMRIDGLELSGVIADNMIETDLIILDSADRQKYVIAGSFLSTDAGFNFKLSPDDVVLNYRPWAVPQDNSMRFGKRFTAENVVLSQGKEQIIIASTGQENAPITLGFRELDLESLTSVIAEERPASGLLHGDINFFPSDDGMMFTTDLTVTAFRIRDIPWGDISLRVARENQTRLNVDVSLNGNQNHVTIGGSYTAGENPSIDITANIERFHLPTLQPLLERQMSDLEGFLEGTIRIDGSPQRPDIDGRITVRDTKFFSNFLNTGFSADNETISFVNDGLSFDQFEIADQSGNIARIDGTILTSNYRDYQFQLDITTDNFRLLNTEEGSNDLFYGRIDMKADAKIRGNTTTPVVDVDIGLADGSHLTYIVPQSRAAALQAQGIVKFVDRSSQHDPFMKQINAEAADTVKSTFRGIDLTARIELTDQERFTIVIDPITADQLSVRGNSTLTLQVNPTGDMNLSGRLEIEEGTYNLSFYRFVKREFQIEKGSSITWLGDPLNAQMDIRAIFEVETAPIELLPNADPTQAKQRLPFMVYLLLKGELLQPDISFRLDMPMDQRNAFGGNVYARLQDINTRESDLNKQVFALLILKRFISDNPFENKAGSGLASTARNSVSKILTEQLNRLSENIKGVELSFDIKSYEDYTSGQAQGQTELQLGVSKSLFSDRLVVKLSGNIDMEGENENRNATDYIGDLAIEYKITPDGRFRINGFRNSNYDMIDGELIETGTGLIYIKDYNTLRELFKANASTKE